jgi:hypothetical protein
MAKAPGQRYASAGAFAADLRRFLGGETIQARPAAFWERGWRWARRRPAVAALIVLSLVATLGMLGGSFWYNARLGKALEERGAALQETRRERGRAVASLYGSLVREAQAFRLARVEGYRSKAWDRLTQALALDTPARNRDELPQEAVASMGDFAGLPPSTFTFADYPARPVSAQLHPSGGQVALGLAHGSVTIRDLATGGERARLAAGDYRGPDPFRVVPLVFGPGGRLLVTGNRDGVIKVWEPDAAGGWAPVRTLTASPKVDSLAVTPDGRYLGSCSWDDSHVTLWNLSDGTQAGRLQAPGEWVNQLAFSPDGTRCAGALRRGDVFGVLLWDMATRQVQGTILRTIGAATMAFSPDGRLVAIGSDHGLEVFDTSDLHRHLFIRGDLPRAAAFSPDGQWLAFNNYQGDVVRIWSVGADREVAALRSPHYVHLLGFGVGASSLVAVGMTRSPSRILPVRVRSVISTAMIGASPGSRSAPMGGSWPRPAMT